MEQSNFDAGGGSELISIQELIKKIQSLHSHFNDDHELHHPFRSIYLYGSSVYENKACKLVHNIRDDDDDSEGYLMIREGVVVGDLDILLVRDGFHHSGLKDLIHEEDRDEKDVFFEQDITLHFKLKGSKGNWYDIETHIMSTSIFMETIRQHKGITCQYVFMDRNEFVIYEDELMGWFRCFWFRNFHFHRRLFRRMIVREADVWCYSKARRLITIEKDYEKGKKNLIHGIRYFRLSNQILENLTINDYTVTNDLKKQVLSQNSTDWKYWEEMFEPMYLSERDEFNKKVDLHIQGGLKVASEYSEKVGVSTLCNIIEDHGLQYLSLNFSTDIIPLAIFDQNGEELDLVKYLTCESLIRVLLMGVKLNSEDYRHHILKQLSNLESDIRGYSILFKITQLEEMERIDETIPRKPLRETNGIVMSATVTDSLEITYKPVAVPLPKVYDEFRWLNTSTKNKTQSSQLSLLEVDEITSISKNYRGDTYILYNYCGKWRWSHPNEDLQYFTKLSNVRHSSGNEKEQFCSLLSPGANFEELNARLDNHTNKNFIFVKPISENYLSLIAVRDLTNNTILDLEPFSNLLFDCKYIQKENIGMLKKKALEMSSDLLYKLPYKCSSQHEKDIVTLLKYLYYLSNSLGFCYDGFNINLKLKSGR
ncbi:predicted protein [Naegleria gruberi]|uniref:Predicted protein n=1 Tax=Naegleria gruberi TaxID=5762 RepID=D2VKE7_NAEGR|nr:uncharacterized protein NAEGRDRAFT_50276 [Naegleria gruberi]EFC42586.1 predicted protein [Naegleria gruberi]|eukprot:XP_002675330.1 predicted protein [Naegleria gruberi strain NEG-M]